MKKLFSILLSAALVTATAFTSIPANAFAANEEPVEFIEEADDYVEVSEEGIIEFNIPDELADKISEEEYNAYLEGIANINQLIEDGELSITENGTIYESDNEELVVQGGNVDDFEWHWWGVRRYASHNSASDIAYKLNKAGSRAGYILTIAGVVALFVPEGLVKLVAGCISIGAGFAWAYFCDVANDINYYNGSRGVIIDVTWVLYFDVCSQ